MRDDLMLSIKRPAVILPALVLLVAATAKIITLLGKPLILSRVDPIFPFNNQLVLTFVAALEFALIGLLISRARNLVKGAMLLWLSASFAGYKAALFFGGYPEPCPCLGGLAGQLGLSKAQLSIVTWLFISILISAGASLVRAGLLDKDSRAEASLSSSAVSIT